ncbi:MAG: hypothetical protein MJZ53_05430 [Paludibacteraceae bacterium]|nr:hypothetical protein [Paludibacteraceae bacterium]
MKKYLFLSLACLMALCAMAQIDAIRVTQGETTDWYPFGKSDRIDVTIYEQGNPVIEGKIYDLTKGNVETAFGTDPLPPIKKAAKNELEDKKKEANNSMNKKAEGYEQIEEVKQAKEQGNAKVMSAADAAKIYIDHATNESTIQKEKHNGLNAMEEETQKTLAGIQAAIAGYKESMKNNINDIAKDAKDTINALGVYNTVKDDAINEIDKAVAAAETSINNATSEDGVKKAKNDAQNNINTQLATVQDYYNKLQAAKVVAIQVVEEAAADAEVAINHAAEGYGNIETVQHAVVTSQTQISSVKDKAKSSINEETNVDGVGQKKENNIKQIKDLQSKAEKDIQDAINEFIALQEDAINEVEQAAATAKEKIDGLGVDESAKIDAKAQIDNIVNTAKQTINAATSKDAIDNAKTEAIAKIYNVVQNLKDTWITVRTDGVAGNWNTICLERNITTIDGATFWTVSGQDATSFILDEVTEPEAGQGYLIRFTKSDLKVKYGDQVAAEPVTASDGNPMQGTYVQIDAAETNVLNGNYVVYNNQLCPVVSWVGLYAHRAYVVKNLIPQGEPAPAPGRQRAYMPKPKETPTSLEANIGGQQPKDGKYIINGQFVIVKDNKMYNAQGIEL